MNVRIGKAKYLVADGGETDSRLQLACAGTEILWSGNSKFAISLVSFNLFFNINQALILGHSLSKYRSALWYHIRINVGEQLSSAFYDEKSEVKEVK